MHSHGVARSQPIRNLRAEGSDLGAESKTTIKRVIHQQHVVSCFRHGTEPSGSTWAGIFLRPTASRRFSCVEWRIIQAIFINVHLIKIIPHQNMWTLISNPTMLYCAFWPMILFYKNTTAGTALRHENAQPLCYAWTHTDIRLCLSLLCRPNTLQSLQRLPFTDQLQVRPYFITVTPANLNFCRSLNTDIQTWPSKHKTRVTLQSRCMLTNQTWLNYLLHGAESFLRS